MRKMIFALALLTAVPMFANPSLFTRYEAVRQGLLKGALADVQSSATRLAADAKKAQNDAVAQQAIKVSKSATLDAARDAFAALSDEMVKVRATAAGAKPSVYYCSMAKKSWLQPKGTIGNPYEPDMPTCGELKAE